MLISAEADFVPAEQREFCHAADAKGSLSHNC